MKFCHSNFSFRARATGPAAVWGGCAWNDWHNLKAIPHNSKCRYGERGTADAKPKAQIILDVLSSILATQLPCRSCRSGA
ncbi:MAG: hypothetical protein WAZ41_09250 [Gemmiger qucibialis]